MEIKLLSSELSNEGVIGLLLHVSIIADIWL